MPSHTAKSLNALLPHTSPWVGPGPGSCTAFNPIFAAFAFKASSALPDVSRLCVRLAPGVLGCTDGCDCTCDRATHHTGDPRGCCSDAECRLTSQSQRMGYLLDRGKGLVRL